MTMMKSYIEAIATELPAQEVTLEEICAGNPAWDIATVEKRVGVLYRHFAQPDETALDLAERACQKLKSQAPEHWERIDALIFCTQTPDHILPSNACILHGRLNLPESVFSFDIHMGCSAFVNGLATANALIQSGMCRSVLLVTADTLSKHLGKHDRSVMPLFGDGAAATLICSSWESQGILDLECHTAGQYFDKIIIPAGGCRLPISEETSKEAADASGNTRNKNQVHMDGLAVLGFTNTRVVRQVQRILARNKISPSEVKLFVFHQASKIALDSLHMALAIPEEKRYVNLHRRGNTVTASIPLALKEAWEENRFQRGDLILVSGFGVGLAWGTALIKW